jgi:hypothetical protein
MGKIQAGCYFHFETCTGFKSQGTPEQFREEYGENWKGGIYALVNISGVIGWYELPYLEITAPVICACTPFGKPPRDWRIS